MDSDIEVTGASRMLERTPIQCDPEQAKGDADGVSVEYLAFMLAGEEYGIEISGVREVVRMMEILEVPRIPDYVLGIISLRGLIIPVFDLKRRLDLMETPETSQTRVIVTAHGKAMYGLLVDSVVGVVPVFLNRVEVPPSGLRTGAEFLKGVVYYSSSHNKDGVDRLMILLKLERVLLP